MFAGNRGLGRFVKLDVMPLDRLAVFIAAAMFAAGCGSSSSTPIAARGSSVSATSLPTTSAATESGSAPAASTPASTDAPIASSTSAPEQTTTTTTPTPLPVEGTGVRGRVTAGPTCPVERSDQPCPPQPVQGTVTAVDSNGAATGTAMTDADGRYAIDLSPGDYTLRVTTAGGPFPRCPDTPVAVTTGPPATADINCDTGIR